MPNSADHMKLSAAAAGITYLVMCRRYNREPDLLEAGACVGAGVIAGVAPDLLEPALHPHHRQLCHSISAGLCLIKAGSAVIAETNKQWTEFAKIVAVCAIVGYIVHLALDACTPRGLPLLGT